MADLVRVFLGILPNATCRAALSQVALGLSRPGLKPTHPDDLHLTLKFLGNIPRESLEPAARAAFSASRQLAPLSFTIAGVKAFGPPEAPKVIWAAISEGLEALEKAHQIADSTFHEFGFPEEGRPFVPHVTLARVSRSFVWEDLEPMSTWDRFLQENGPRHFGSMRAGTVVLMESRGDPSPGEPKYSVLESYLLSAVPR